MAEHQRAGVVVAQCTSCDGLFLRGSDRGLLVVQENDWHLSSGPTTQPIPRITPEMTVPGAVMPTRESRSFVDELFG